MDVTLYAIGNALKTLGLPTSFWTAARTKFNRLAQGYTEDHRIDAACVGKSGANVNIRLRLPLYIKATGRGNRQMCKMDKFAFPRTRKCKDSGKRVPAEPKRSKRVEGFQTGDHVRAIIPAPFWHLLLPKRGVGNIKEHIQDASLFELTVI